jgi:hypothetical protein
MADEDSALASWLLAGVGAVVGSLVGAVTYLFRKTETENARAIGLLQGENSLLTKRVDECETDRSQLRSEVAGLRVKVDFIERELMAIDENGTKFSHRANRGGGPEDGHAERDRNG